MGPVAGVKHVPQNNSEPRGRESFSVSSGSHDPSAPPDAAYTVSGELTPDAYFELLLQWAEAF
jgi:hypothetical protein